MPDVYKPPFGAYAVTAGHAPDATAKADMALNFTNLKGMFQQTVGTSLPHPDFVEVKPSVAAAIGAEIDAIAALVAAWA